MTPTREQELAVLRSVVYASLFDYPLDAGAARIEPDWRPRRRGDDRVAGGARAICCRRRSSIATGSTSLRADPIWWRTRSRREALSRELLDRDRRILSLRREHAVRADGGAIGQPRSPQRRGLCGSRSVRDHRAEPGVERDGRDGGAVEAAWLAQAALHELRGVGARDGDRAARSVFGEPDHSPAADGRATRSSSASSKSNPFVQEFLSELSNCHRSQARKARKPASPLRARPLARLRAGRRKHRAAVIRLAPEAALGELAIERSGEARTGMPEAAYEQPSGVDACEVRRRDG